MRKIKWILILVLIVIAVMFVAYEYIDELLEIVSLTPDQEVMKSSENVETLGESQPPLAYEDVLIYTNKSAWITIDQTRKAAETTKSLLDAEAIQVEISNDDAYVREWMQQTTDDGKVNVIVLYGVLPSSIYEAGNSQPDGSIAENWIETTDGDTILNHADYIAYNSDYDVDKANEWNLAEKVSVSAVDANIEYGLTNLMDNTAIFLYPPVPDPDVPGSEFGGPVSMIVTADGSELTPSLVGFDSFRPIPLKQLQDNWFVEQVFASDTGDAQSEYADPVIVRDGSLGRLAIVHATRDQDGLLNGEVTAEIIANYLYAK